MPEDEIETTEEITVIEDEPVSEPEQPEERDPVADAVAILAERAPQYLNIGQQTQEAKPEEEELDAWEERARDIARKETQSVEQKVRTEMLNSQAPLLKAQLLQMAKAELGDDDEAYKIVASRISASTPEQVQYAAMNPAVLNDAINAAYGEARRKEKKLTANTGAPGVKPPVNQSSTAVRLSREKAAELAELRIGWEGLPDERKKAAEAKWIKENM